jgi:hypothetical protein
VSMESAPAHPAGLGGSGSLKENWKRWLKVAGMLAVVLLALEMRLTAVQLTEVDSPLRADALDYFSYAYNMVNGGYYSRILPDPQVVAAEPQQDFLRSPGFPVLLR